jgi:hypothetical protein
MRSGSGKDFRRKEEQGRLDGQVYDGQPLFRFHRWLANLRVPESKQVKSVLYARVSHPFVERSIGTVRRE